MLIAAKQLLPTSQDPNQAYVIWLLCAQVHVLNTTKVWLRYTLKDHYTTDDAAYVQVETNYDFWFVVHYGLSIHCDSIAN